MSKSTKNYKLFKYEDNDNADLTFLGSSMDIIDGGLSPFFVATLDSSNNYKVTTGLNLTELKNGFSVRVAIPSASTGATSLIIDSISAIAIKKVNGNAVSNLKANGVYSLTYYNGNFILASGSDESDSTSVGTDGSNVKTGITFVGTDGEVHTGTYTSDGTITADKVLSGYVGYSKAQKIIGTMVNRGAPISALNCGGTYNLAEGYYTGGKVTANSLASQTPANASAAQILSGYNAWVNGGLVNGIATIFSLGGINFIRGSHMDTAGSSSSFSFDAGFTPTFIMACTQGTLSYTGSYLSGLFQYYVGGKSYIIGSNKIVENSTCIQLSGTTVTIKPSSVSSVSRAWYYIAINGDMSGFY